MGISAVMGMQGAGAGLSMMGSVNQANAQRSTLDYESQVAGNNAQLAMYQASVAQNVGAQQVQTSDLKNAALMSQQRATMAANGVDLGSGSATDILASTKYLGERDALTIEDNTARQVWADKMNAANFGAEANADKSIGGSIKPWLAGSSSLLTGAGTVANTWYRNKQQTGN